MPGQLEMTDDEHSSDGVDDNRDRSTAMQKMAEKEDRQFLEIEAKKTEQRGNFFDRVQRVSTLPFNRNSFVWLWIFGPLQFVNISLFRAFDHC